MLNLIFDMDGTIVDLYSQKNWLSALQIEDESIFATAKPMKDYKEILYWLEKLRSKDIVDMISICSWTSMESSQDFHERVEVEKIEWLDGNEFPYDNLKILKYGTSKSKPFDNPVFDNILFDDNEDVRREFESARECNWAFSEKDIIRVLKLLYEYKF